MKEELISFETAKLAKEKGFVEHTIKSYDKWGNISTYNYIENHPNCILMLPCCTQSLLKKWLREKHNIIIYPAPYLGDGETTWACCIFINRQDIKDGFEEYNSYEECLEYGLQESLKLIAQ